MNLQKNFNKFQIAILNNFKISFKLIIIKKIQQNEKFNFNF